MTADQMLEQAISASRDGATGAPSFAVEVGVQPAARTRARVVKRVVRRRLLRQTTTALLAVAFAVVCAPAAYAAVTGKLPSVLVTVTRVLRLGSGAHGESPAPQGRVGAPQVASEAASRADGARVAATEARHTVYGSRAPEQRVSTDAHASTPLPRASQRARPTRASTPSHVRTLYATAHRLHFVQRDPAAALRAWDAYLRVAAGDALVPEARYDRAIDLVRLRRFDEARTALAPFARGEVLGGYRSVEAQRLLLALERGAVQPVQPNGASD